MDYEFEFLENQLNYSVVNVKWTKMIMGIHNSILHHQFESKAKILNQ